MSEDRKERIDRELMELLNELRVALPGVQVLFAFLLTVPFSQAFGSVTPTQRNVYYASFVCTAIASLFLIAPTTYHRIEFRDRDKEHMIFVSNYLALVGMVFLALAIVCVVFVITDLVLGGSFTPVATALGAGLYGWLWFGYPLTRRLRD